MCEAEVRGSIPIQDNPVCACNLSNLNLCTICMYLEICKNVYMLCGYHSIGFT